MNLKVGDVVEVVRLQATGIVIDVHPSNRSYIEITFFHPQKIKTNQKYFNPNYETIKVLS